ncbi:hypothetical protein IQ227_13425 [Anabaena aphanizomenioides LEGE 00250]|uniref:Uncharacterized protein n=1 Tax=Sphaerospermopsis aphanizomenoides LEGE 00250 TaxID=2777972 RepID=A0ABR9VET7_9CYAN|nr:hypothetical protein [Sphaerospermopsis aphanizomenoides LEGE 00250]
MNSKGGKEHKGKRVKREFLVLLQLFFQNWDAPEWKNSGFLKPSIIKPVLTTIAKGLVIKKLGQLQEIDRQELQNLLQVILGK